MAASARPRSGGGGAPTATSGSDLAQRLHSFTSELDYVYRTLRRYGVGPTDAEDLSQEVFLVAWRRRMDFDDTRPLRPWLAGIAFKVAHHHHRRRPPEDPDAHAGETVQTLAVELQPEALDARALVLRGLASLPEHHRTVLILHDLDGLSADEIAALWGMPRFTLYTRLRRARHAFAKEIARLQESDPSRRGTKAAALAPAQLLAVERDLPPAPAGLRERLLERLRVEAELAPAGDPAPASPWPPPAASPGVLRPWLLVAGAGLGLAIATLAVSLRPSTVLSPAPDPAPRPASVTRARTPGALPPPRLATAAAPIATRPGLAGLGRDLTGFWRFDDGPGNTLAADRSGGRHHCELRDLDPAQAWVPGAVGGAIELGLNGWLECPQPDLPARRTAAFTVAVWVKRAGNPHMHHALAMRPMGGGRGNYFFFGFVGDQIKVQSSGWGGVLEAPFKEATGRWVHVAFTYDADQSLELYVGGVEVARSKGKPRKFGPVQGPLRVGAGLAGEERDRIGQRFEGAIDELAVYERALSPAEIGALSRGAVPDPGR
jgi:RNA polymerase sigma-70 factor (ECF subfamily)